MKLKLCKLNEYVYIFLSKISEPLNKFIIHMISFKPLPKLKIGLLFV